MKKRKKDGKWPKPGRHPKRPAVVASRAFNRRLAKQYSEMEPTNGAASGVRSLSGDELAARKAELEARGLPPDKPKAVLPSYRGKKTKEIEKQFFVAPAGIVGR